MIKFIDGDLFNSRANFLINFIDCSLTSGSKIALANVEKYSHIEKEYMKYVHHCMKSNVDIVGTTQYVPVDVWALIMVDTIKNDNVEAYDEDYQYIVNMFGQNADLKSMKKAFVDIREKAQKINAVVGIPYRIGNANWDDIYTIIKKVFEYSNINVEIYKK